MLTPHFVVSPLQALYNKFGFFAPLTSSLVLSRGTGSATFTRASVATVMGYDAAATSSSSQVLLTVASGEARFQGARRVSEGVWSSLFADGTPIPDATLKGYLAEGSRTNLCLQSNTFSNASWTKSGGIAATQNTTGPDGATSGWQMTGSGAQAISQTFTATAAAWTASLFIAKTTGSTSYPVISLERSPNAAIYTFDPNTGTMTAWTSRDGGWSILASTARVESFNSAWWRISITATITAADYTLVWFPAAGGTATYAGPTIGGAGSPDTNKFFGAQLELGSFPSSYIPTTMAAVTRAADSDSYATSGNFSDTAGTIYFETEAASWANASGRIVGDAAEGILASSSNSGVQVYDGTNTVNGSAGSPSGQISAAVSWSGSTMKVCVNGGTVASGSYDGAWNLSAIFAGNGYFGNIRNVRVAKVALIDRELQTLTS